VKKCCFLHPEGIKDRSNLAISSGRESVFEEEVPGSIVYRLLGTGFGKVAV
jgi:hypothetical protein